MSPTSRGAARVREMEIMTPEGVPLRFKVALAGDRIAALLLDVVVLLGASFVLVLPLIVLAFRGDVGGDLLGAAAVLILFLVRTFYFAFFELAWRGQTPGKRRNGIRVIDASGGALSAEAIVARNLTREVELFLPLVALLAPEALFPGAPGWARLAALAWAAIFGFMPLFNRDRQRVGDLVAGTVVVRLPAAALLEDMADAASRRARPEALSFAPEELDVYGVYELQVLEQVLRDEGKPGHAAALAAVAEKVRAKIDFHGAAPSDEVFLRAFYAALRARLEHRLLLGKRRADKHDRS